MASGLVVSSAASQLVRCATDVGRACTKAGVAVLAREGASRDVLGALAASTAELLPNAMLIDGLQVLGDRKSHRIM
jgi:hypothetical protein